MFKRATPRIVGNKLNVPAADLNPLLTCFLCNGFLVDPYTVKECVHSFCKSCIYKFVSVNPKCPRCAARLSSIPFEQLSPDRALQGLIIKCFPEKVAEDAAREKAFYERMGIENPRAGEKRARTEDEEQFVAPRAVAQPPPVLPVTPLAVAPAKAATVASPAAAAAPKTPVPKAAASAAASPSRAASNSSPSAGSPSAEKGTASEAATKKPRTRTNSSPARPMPAPAVTKPAKADTQSPGGKSGNTETAEMKKGVQKPEASTPLPLKSSMRKVAPMPDRSMQPVSSEIRFRLYNPMHPIDKKVVFTAARESSLRRNIPFLRDWLTKHGHTGKLQFVMNGEIVDLGMTFLALFGPSRGTHAEPIVFDFILTNE